MFDFLSGFLLGAKARTEKIEKEHAERMEAVENEQWERRKNTAAATIKAVMSTSPHEGVSEFSRNRRAEQIHGNLMNAYLRRSDMLMKLVEEDIRILVLRGC